ncbi:MAG: arylsulfatase [Victivallaceae bacterium]|nr:arylsulfatase [Victivallaceae bacterium]
MRKPNIVFVLTDDQGYPPLGCHGHPFIQTPGIDEFHGDAVCFEQFHCGTTCAPTRAGLLTGHYCNSTGVWHTVGGRSLLRRDEWSLADALRSSGYHTGIFGKWHLGDDYPYRPQDRGFETTVCHGGGGISQQPDYWGNDYFDDTYWVNGVPRKFTGYCTDVFFDEGMKYIEEHKDEPFFCYISTNAPHGPFNVDEKYFNMYKDQTESENYARFLGMITNIDENFTKLRAKLAELELEDDTILIFMSDNGQCGDATSKESNTYNAGMRGFKGSEYDGGHRIPFLMRWPNGSLKDGRKVDDLTSYVDFMPTLLDICGVDMPQDKKAFDGESLMPLLNGEKSQEYWDNRIVVTDTQRVAHPLKWQRSCVMKNSWRLVDRDELYDLSNDPDQEHNIAAGYPELVDELREKYEKWWTLCTLQADEETPLSIGMNYEVSCLNTMDLRNEHGMSVWNQQQVREGETCLGFWSIYAEQDGVYEFELRRWPEEAGHAVSAGINPEEDVEFDRKNIAPENHGFYSGAKALDIDLAQLHILGLPVQCESVEAGQNSVKFEIKLNQGQYQLRANFFNRKLSILTAAYYIYVRLLV